MKNVRLFKEEIKRLTVKIREKKKSVKEMQRAGTYSGREQYNLIVLRSEARHVFIAYAIYRGVSLSKLEGKEDIEYNQKLVESIQERLSPKEEVSL